MPTMSLPADYISGTITLTNGSPNFTGTGTGWQAADFREGDILLGVEDHAGQVYVIAAITGNATGTLTQEWAGTSGTYTYRMRYEWDSSRVSAQARAMVELLGNGNLESIAGLTGPGVVVLEGPHSAGIRPFSDFVNGVAYNVQVDTLADRAAYDGQSAGFAVLVSDTGDGRSAVYSKASNTSGDWTDPAYITGPIGPLPEVEATVTSLPPGSTATVTPTPIAGGVRLDFELPEAEGFYWFSAYDPGEEYIKDSVVRHNRSAFIATQAVPVGENPSNAFPPVDNTYWDVLAAGGANGEGTVSSVEQGSGIVVDDTDPTAPIVSLDAALGDLKDVDLTTNPPEDGQVIIWDETGEKWVPGESGGGGADMPTARLKGRVSPGDGPPENLTASQALTLLKTAGAFAKDNILGIVSQASGIPTGAIIEYGTNANGEYIRFADGTQVCARVASVSTAISTAWGSVFVSGNVNVGDYAAAFVATPTLSVLSAQSVIAAVMHLGNHTTTSFGQVWLMRGTSQAADTRNIHAIAMGRWF